MKNDRNDATSLTPIDVDAAAVKLALHGHLEILRPLQPTSLQDFIGAPQFIPCIITNKETGEKFNCLKFHTYSSLISPQM